MALYCGFGYRPQGVGDLMVALGCVDCDTEAQAQHYFDAEIARRQKDGCTAEWVYPETATVRPMSVKTI